MDFSWEPLRTSDVCSILLPLRKEPMKTMLQTISTANLAEAAKAASAPYRHSIVADDRRPGFASTLAERCAR